MPDEKQNDPVPAIRADAPKVEEKARLPETPDERRKRRLDACAAENDQVRFERRTAEFKVHFDAHMQNIKEAHEAYPAPLNSKLQPWESLSDKEKHNWNERSKVIASANKAYYLACKRTFADHQDEEAHLARLRRTKQEAA